MPEKKRSALAVGLAFVVGTLVFIIVFQLVRYFGPGSYEPLTPIDQRASGELTAPILLPPPSSLASMPAATAPAWNLADQKGRVVIVNYFATWCGPCLSETPDLVKIAQEYGPRGVVTVAISLDRDEDRVGGENSRIKAVQRYVTTNQVPYPILVPPADSMLWKMEFPIPQTFLYDRQGRRARRIVGPIDDRNFRTSLDELLKEPS